jgi:hypothetical protein
MNEINNKGLLRAVNLSFVQRFELNLFGFTKSEMKIKEGWKEERQFYFFKCKKHGIVENHLKGYKENLRCPKCIAGFSVGCLPDVLQIS